jgi:hypothetical protein
VIDYNVDSPDMIERGKEAAGNWRQFNSFAWFRQSELDDPYNWMIINTTHRDAGLLQQSNAEAIEKEMEDYQNTDDIYKHSANHWAVGWVEGWEIRVFTDKNEMKVTEPFAKMCKLNDAIEDYPILDESDYSEKEYDATMENISTACWGKAKDEDDLPDDWVCQMYGWFSENMPEAIESCDDQGGCPDDEQAAKCLKALDFYDYDDDEESCCL